MMKKKTTKKKYQTGGATGFEKRQAKKVARAKTRATVAKIEGEGTVAQKRDSRAKRIATATGTARKKTPKSVSTSVTRTDNRNSGNTSNVTTSRGGSATGGKSGSMSRSGSGSSSRSGSTSKSGSTSRSRSASTIDQSKKRSNTKVTQKQNTKVTQKQKIDNSVNKRYKKGGAVKRKKK